MARNGSGGTVLSTGEPVLGFFDAMDQQRMELSVDGHFPRIAFQDQDGKDLLELSLHCLLVAEPEHFCIVDNKGTRLSWLTVHADKKED